MKTTLQKTFANPPSIYRGKPFWAWNGKLEEGELRRQIRTMHRMGLGGFFMHSRVGLATPYLSREWFDLVGACIDEARKLKMEAWLYDEDRWPSGAAGGLVTKNPRYRMRSLIVQRVPSRKAIPADWRVVAIFAATPGTGAVVRNVQRVDGPHARAPGKGQALYVFHEVLDRPSDWYNGYTYLDTLNPAAVRAFIRTTHEAYRRRVGRHFGRVVPGIFTDEPHFFTGGGNPRDVPFEHSIPWTGRLCAVFKQRYGYNLIPHLMEVVFDVEGQTVAPARYHFHDCLTHLFVEAFARQIGAWCARHKLMFTGHVLCEDSLSSQTWNVGDSMRSYEFMQAPGMDLLTEHWRIYDTAKQLSSAAHQFGQTWRLTETYGCTGWDFPLEGHKALGDWQVALGLNLRCQHLAWYTMAGEAKRDYPASISDQSPWWDVYAKVEDYFARVNVVMTRGTEVRDLLVIHPMESMWLLHRKAWDKDPAVKTLDKLLPRVRDMLLQQHLDFDYGCEDIMARHGRITLGAQGPELRIGRAAYRAVLVPPLLTIRRSTLDLLRRFHDAGGTVVFAGNPPPYVEARPSGEPANLANDCVRIALAETALARALAPVCRRVSIRTPQGKEIPAALYLLREDPTAFFLFICNTSHSADQFKLDQKNDVMVHDRIQTYPEVQIAGFADCAGAPQEWRPEDGRITEARAHRNTAGQWVINTSLARLASRLFVIPKKSVTGFPPPVPALRERAMHPLKVNAWNIRLSEPNVLALDRPRYRIGHGAWQPETEILRVDRAVRSALGIPLRGGQMVQPWAQKPDRAHKTV
ncbi:MAG: glycosyl hydrolase, partial [Kiritimatiellota bacterium]|nr:glycosyl hydrolase [Kiritimatiellota bacterium]